jgi:uncharacterized lipoprotein YmbA
MTIRSLFPALLSLVFFGCISQNDPVSMHHFQPHLSPISAEQVPGTAPLRLGPVVAAPHLGLGMVWRLSTTELAEDEIHRWAEAPAAVLDERLRDLLFATGGFRDSLRTGIPSLAVRLTACEGRLDGTARLEVVVDLAAGEEVAYRTRFTEEEPMESMDAGGLAGAVGVMLESVAERVVIWVGERVGD